MRNASGDGVIISKSRFELGRVAPGETKTVEFPFELTPAMTSDELVLEVLMYDATLGTTARERLQFPVRPVVPRTDAPAGVEVKVRRSRVRSGASASNPQVATARRGATLPALGTFGPWIKVDLGAGETGFVPAKSVGRTSGAVRKPTGVQPFWNSTPPAITVDLAGLSTQAAVYPLAGTVTSETRVEGRVRHRLQPRRQDRRAQVLYLSNRGARTRNRSGLQGHPAVAGTSQVVVVARENTEVQALERFFIYRETQAP
ncbi:MAG: hypothetical protein R2939_10710 [Kofleriaceae bacterium]